jgi:hypothetical protein
MANVDFPRGFMLINGENYSFMTYDVDGDTATTIAPGDIVSQVVDYGVIRSTANDGDIVVGVVITCYDTNDAVLRWLPASTAGKVLVACATQGAVFTAQDDASAALTIADVGQTTNHVDGAVETFRGRSTQELNATVGGGQLRLIGRVISPDNAYGNNCLWKCTFVESIFMNNTAV